MNDPIKVCCPKCNKRLVVNRASAGKRVRCPVAACGNLIQVPAREGSVEEREGQTRGRAPQPLWPWLAGAAGALALAAVAVVVWLLSGPAPTQVTGGDPPPAPARDRTGKDKNKENQATNRDRKDPKGTPAGKLPGASGERITYLTKPPHFRAVTFRDPEKKDKKDLENWPAAAWPQTFSPGIKKVTVEVVFTQEVQAAVAVRILTPAGPLKVANPDQAGSFSVNGFFVRWFDIEVADGPLPEGPYRAEVAVDGKKVAVMNWSVAKASGEEKPVPVPGISDADLPRSGQGDPSITYDMVRKNPAGFRGKRVTWAFQPFQAFNKRVLAVVDRARQLEVNFPGLYVIDFNSNQEASQAVRDMVTKGFTVTATVAGGIDQDLVIRDGTGKGPKDTSQAKLPLLMYAQVGREPEAGPDPRPKARLTIQAHKDFVYAVALDGRGKLIASAGQDGVVKLWDAEGKTLAVFNGRSPIALTRDGKTLLTTGDKVLKLYDVGTRKVRKTLFGEAHQAVFSPDGKLVAQALQKPGPTPSGVHIRVATTGKEFAVLETGGAPFTFSADGKRLVAASSEKTLGIWTLPKGQFEVRLAAVQEGVQAITLSPDGKRVAAGCDDNAVRIWDADSGRILFTLRGHTRSVTGVVFTHDGKRVISASYDGTLRVWEAASGRDLGEVVAHDRAVSSLAISADGRTLATASFDGTVKLWDLPGTK